MADLSDIIEAMDKPLRDAFLEAIEDIRSEADLERIVAAIEAGNIDEVLDELRIQPSFFGSFQEALRLAYLAGARDAFRDLPPPPGSPRSAPRLVVRFDAGRPEIQGRISALVGKEVTAVSEATKLAVREFVETGIVEGKGAMSVGLDIVGRIDPVSKKRAGGILGLSRTQARALDAAREELTDPKRYADFLRRSHNTTTAADRAMVKRAMRTGKAIPAGKVEDALRRYSNRLLRVRGRAIARTEGLRGVHMGNQDAFRQMIADGVVRADDVVKIWRAVLDPRTRDSHALLNGEQVGFEGYFVSPVTNAMLKHPGDPDAPASESINCRCSLEVRIVFLRNKDVA